ncbi:MAG: sigma-70 family RNA polymerase sigma factor [Candidatus Omnitrophica bacterium]|nr:sigma-70 family RNA polymerase sigma factor [Candidatus Omnitrophota bacterium]
MDFHDRAQRVSHSPEISLMVSEAVSALPLSQREVIVLNRYQGMSYAEIGVVLGISENAVKQRAFQAMQKLRRSLNIVGRNPREA